MKQQQQCKAMPVCGFFWHPSSSLHRPVVDFLRLLLSLVLPLLGKIAISIASFLAFRCTAAIFSLLFSHC